MKSLFKVFLSVAALLICLGVVSSCGSKKAETEEAKPIELVTTATDSTEVLNLAYTFMDYLKSGNAEAAIDMLGNSNPDSISSYDALPLDLPEDVKARYAEIYKDWDVVSYEVVNFDFGGYTVNQLRCRLTMANGDQRTINFNPIRGVNSWRLTIRDSARGDRKFEQR